MLLYVLATLFLIITNAHTFEIKDHASRQKRLIGAAFATIEDYPYNVAIEIEGKFSCSGSILSQYNVLTAAHCVNETIDIIKVRSGSSWLQKGGTLHDVADKVQHEDYEINAYLNTNFDLAILRVKQPFVYSKKCQPIELNSEIFPYNYSPDSIGVVTGWGYFDKTERLSFRLKAMSMNLLSKRHCNETYETFGGIYEGQMCAGYKGVPHWNTCQGDSGGGLMHADKLIGVLAYSEGACGLLDYPAIYTEVAYFHKWICKHVRFYQIV